MMIMFSWTLTDNRLMKFKLQKCLINMFLLSTSAPICSNTTLCTQSSQQNLLLIVYGKTFLIYFKIISMLIIKKNDNVIFFVKLYLFYGGTLHYQDHFHEN